MKVPRKITMNDATKIIETENHVIEIDPTDYKQIKKECKKLGITTDYYFFEFQMWEDEIDV
tara:strand:- start:1513 stop:1695 length:183 start_codon:yes stop_codon:yes gene_type:complete